METVIHQNNGGEKKTMKRRMPAMHVIKVVLYMLRRKRRKSLNTGFWRRLVESIRPGFKHSNITIMPPPSPPPAVAPIAEDGHHDDHVKYDLSKEVEEEEDDDDDDDVFTAAASSSTSSAASASRSQYGSAVSLSEMDVFGNDDDDDQDHDDDDDGGDEMIDVKAEEFIMRFYAQMRMQNQAYIDRRNAKLMHMKDNA